MRPSRRLTVAAAALIFTGALGACGSTEPSTSGSAAATRAAGIRTLDVAAFATLAAAPSTVVLDVRTPQEFASGHLTGAKLIDFEAADFDARLAELDRHATYAVYCRSDNRSGQALARMQAAGFTDAAHLAGGINAWTAAGQPVTTT